MRSKMVLALVFSLGFVACVGATNISQQKNAADVVKGLCDGGETGSCFIRHNNVVSKPLNPAKDDVPVVIKHCPDGMVYVSGEYCPVVQETCLYFVDTHGHKIPETKRWPGRCGEYKAPTKCLSTKKVHKEFCIDKFEYPNIAEHIPQSWMSWYDVKASCESEGKRLCTKSEWTFGCEGPDMHPYPYGDGFHRDLTACNFDRSTKGINVFACTPHKDNVSGRMVAPAVGAPCRKQLDSLLVPSGSMPRCVSPFGVFDQVANIDEFVVNETGHPYKSSLVGGHIFGVRNACRPQTENHSPKFAWYETGGRCCNDAK